MINFNSDTLTAAKNAGIPISVLVGILAILGGLIGTKNLTDQKRFFTIVACGVSGIVSLLFIFWVSTRETYRWVDTKALAGSAGNDEGWTDTREPLEKYCDRSREGNVAICWSNRPEGYPAGAVFEGTFGARAWCAYKTEDRATLGQSDGSPSGKVYICVRVSI
jgi:hypothetical protein